MTAALAAANPGESRRADDRRLTVAIGASLVIHALTLAVLRGVVPASYATPQGGTGGFAALQAVLAGPKVEPAPEAQQLEVPQPLVAPPEAHPIEPPVPRRSHAGPQAASATEQSGATLPDFSIGVGTIDDPAKLGQDFVARLAVRFPERISKAPVLIGTPVMTYPQAALESGVQRRVAALVMLRADGTIEDAQLARDDPLFGPAVLEALKSARFAPAEIDGNVVPYWAIVEFVFLIGRPPPQAVTQRGPARRGFVFPRQPSNR
jgi:outer membrane biosynthesis protein TonB